MLSKVMKIIKKIPLSLKLFLSYLIVCLIPLLISMYAYHTAITIVKNDAQINNLNTLKQCRAILDSRFKELDSMVTQMATSSLVTKLALKYSPYVDGTTITSIRNLQDDLASTEITYEFINAICIYFKKSNILITNQFSYINMDQYYSYFFKHPDMSDAQWHDTILNGEYGRQVFPAARILNDTVLEKTIPDSTAYILYIQSFPLQSGHSGTIFALINEEKILNLLSPIDIQQGGYAYISDKNGLILAQNSVSGEAITPIEIADPQKESILLQEVDGEQMIVSYTTSEYNDWLYVAALPSNIVMEKARYLRSIVIYTLCFSLITGLFLSMYLVKRNIKPLMNIIRTIKKNYRVRESEERNEYGFLNDSFKSLIENYSQLSQRYDEQKPLLKITFFERLLSNGFQNMEDVRKAASHLDIELIHGKLLVIIISLRSPVQVETNPREIGATKILLNEILEQYLEVPFYFFDYDFRKSVIIMNACLGNEDDFRKDIEIRLAPIVKYVHNQLCTEITLAIGSFVEDYTEIGNSFEDAMNALNYGNIKPYESPLLWYSDILFQKEYYWYPTRIENKLASFLNLGDCREIHKLLDHLYQENFIKRNLSGPMAEHLVYALRCTLIRSIDFLKIDKASICCELEELTKDGIDRIPVSLAFDRIRVAFSQLCTQLNLMKKNEKNYILIKEAVHYIDSHYQDSQMNQTAIAESLGITAPYFSRLFKEQIGVNFTEYVETVRINFACSLLLEGYSVNNAASKAGYNSSYVFRNAFHRIKGINPSSYRRNDSMQKTPGTDSLPPFRREPVDGKNH